MRHTLPLIKLSQRLSYLNQSPLYVQYSPEQFEKYYYCYIAHLRLSLKLSRRRNQHFKILTKPKNCMSHAKLHFNNWYKITDSGTDVLIQSSRVGTRTRLFKSTIKLTITLITVNFESKCFKTFQDGFPFIN